MDTVTVVTELCLIDLEITLFWVTDVSILVFHN